MSCAVEAVDYAYRLTGLRQLLDFVGVLSIGGHGIMS